MDTDFRVEDYDCVNCVIDNYRIVENMLILECTVRYAYAEVIFDEVQNYVLDERMIGGKITWLRQEKLDDGYKRFCIELSGCAVGSVSITAKRKRYREE